MIITSAKGNHYYLSPSIPQIFFIHPILKEFIELEENGTDLRIWLEKKMASVGETSLIANENKYYYRFFQFLKEKDFFNKIKKVPLEDIRSYSAEFIKMQLANTDQISFEVTDACNLKCYYCGYGELYCGYDKRNRKKMSMKTAKRLLDYMIALKRSHLNTKTHRRIGISFYGGEPLLNFPFIRSMVEYVKGIKLDSIDFIFVMTTNGVLLDRYMDFLAANRFTLLISLDGDKNHNGYRVYPDSQDSYTTVFNNALKLKEKYPEYFRRFVNFISVMHDKNNVYQVIKFFHDHFNKRPLTVGICTVGVKPEKYSEFERIKKSIMSKSEIEQMQEMMSKAKVKDPPTFNNMDVFIKRYCGFVYNRLDAFFSKSEQAEYVTTGTCHPFEKKVFLTVNGKILPCERILQSHASGKADDHGVQLDFQKIADYYNSLYDNCKNKCNACSRSSWCGQCIFQLNPKPGEFNCKNFLSREEFQKRSWSIMSLLEESPEFYDRIMKQKKGVT